MKINTKALFAGVILFSVAFSFVVTTEAEMMI